MTQRITNQLNPSRAGTSWTTNVMPRPDTRPTNPSRGRGRTWFHNNQRRVPFVAQPEASIAEATPAPLESRRGKNKFRGKYRGRGRGTYANNNNNSGGGYEGNSNSAPQGNVIEIPGFVYDPATRKHFRIAQEGSGVSGFTERELVARRREQDRQRLFSANRPRYASASFAMDPVVHPLPDVVDRLSLGMGNMSIDRVRRHIGESMLLNAQNTPSLVVDTPVPSSTDEAVACHFLDVAPNGKTVWGYWDTKGVYDGTELSMMYCISAGINAKLASSECEALDNDDNPTSKPRNTMGLEFSAMMDSKHLDTNSTMVDMCTAQVDRDVTCALYANARTDVTSDGLRSYCKLALTPLYDLCAHDSERYMLAAPIYNYQESFSGKNVFSLAWNASKMSISLGFEGGARVLNTLSRQYSATIPTNNRIVLSQEFSQDGNSLYMGVHLEDVKVFDLRTRRSPVSSFRGSRSAGWVKQLKSQHPDCLLTETFQGNLRLWDSRRTDRPLLSMKGHKNSHYRLPCFVDHDENFVFAVGSDGCSRGWSLNTGNLLCQIASPRPVEERGHFPRVVFHARWGGTGRPAVLLALGGQLRLHQLDLC